jgi:hypothetical protein
VLSKQLQDPYINVEFFSDTQLKPHWRFFIQNYKFYRTNHHLQRKGSTGVAVRKGIPHSHADLHLLTSIEVTRICISIGKSKILLAAVYKSPGHT